MNKAKLEKNLKLYKESFAGSETSDSNVRKQLTFDIKICLVENGYPPQYSPEAFNKVMEQVENFEENGVND